MAGQCLATGAFAGSCIIVSAADFRRVTGSAVIMFLLAAVCHAVWVMLLLNTHMGSCPVLQQHQLVVTCPHSHYFMCFRFKIFV